MKLLSILDGVTSVTAQQEARRYKATAASGSTGSEARLEWAEFSLRHDTSWL